MIVVDASIALAWCLADESDDLGTRALDRVVAETAIAPAHWPLEVANGLRTAIRHGRLSPDEMPRLGRLLGDLGIAVHPVELSTAITSVLDLALVHALSAYDAAYLDLARLMGVAIATLDVDLREACRSAGVDVVA